MMNEKIDLAVDRLNKVLPLKENQASLTAQFQQLHRDILFSYVDIGRSLNRTELAQRVESLDELVTIFQEKDLVVFSTSGEPIGAYPFTMEARKHEVRVNGNLLHCMCALDSLAVSPMYGIELEIKSVCDLSDETIFIRQNGYELTDPSEVDDVFFAINWNAANNNSCCADSLCTEMIFIKGEDAAKSWCNDDSQNREMFTLPDAIEFAAGLFMPLVKGDVDRS